jgi:hypothetical protein
LGGVDSIALQKFQFIAFDAIIYIYKQAWLVVSGRASHVSASVQELSPKQQQMR